MPTKGLRERLRDGDDIVVAEGYLFEFERRGYLRAGCFVPEVVLEHPEQLRALHEEFVHAGSDVVIAFTYYGHREKLKHIGREQDLEILNKTALRIAREVADATGTLMAGNLCNTCVYEQGNESAIAIARGMFKEQVEWAVECGADYMVGETFSELGEALLALQCIKDYGKGLPALISLAPHAIDTTNDGVPFDIACRKLEEAGADIVGLNCQRGPDSMMPLIRAVKKACKGPISLLPVPYRTTLEKPTYQTFKEEGSDKMAFPDDLPAFTCSRSHIAKFAEEAKELGIKYIGLCCGNASHYIRVVAEVYGRKPPASKYSPDMSQHYLYGDNVKSYHSKKLVPHMN